MIFSKLRGRPSLSSAHERCRLQRGQVCGYIHFKLRELGGRGSTNTQDFSNWNRGQ